MNRFEYDTVIIGGGVIGAAVARELSQYDLKLCLIEREEDVCSGTSKANSAIVHAGFDAVPGSMKAKMNLEGNRLMEQLSKDLDFEFKRNGSLVLCFTEDDRPALNKLYEKGVENGVPELSIITGDKARQMEPNISAEVVAAIYAPTGGIVCPFGMTIALAENACDNGVEFRFKTQVKKIEKMDVGFRLITSDGEVTSRYVVNAAGVYSDEFHNMVSEEKIHITPRKGDYWLLDKEAGNHISHTIFQLPGVYGKGVLVTPTVHGNLLLGPTAVDIYDKEETATTAAELTEIRDKSIKGVKNIPYHLTITSFSGIRAHEECDDFILGEPVDAEGFFDAAGIESPGLSSAPAIGKYLSGLIAERSGAGKKKGFKPVRRGIVRAADLDLESRAALIRENPAYGSIVCRCEEISEGEIKDAVTRTLGAVSLDGIKRRVRAGAGRCQAGFCTPKTMELLAEKLGCSIDEICKNSGNSKMILGSMEGEAQ